MQALNVVAGALAGAIEFSALLCCVVIALSAAAAAIAFGCAFWFFGWIAMYLAARNEGKESRSQRQYAQRFAVWIKSALNKRINGNGFRH